MRNRATHRRVVRLGLGGLALLLVVTAQPGAAAGPQPSQPPGAAPGTAMTSQSAPGLRALGRGNLGEIARAATAVGVARADAPASADPRYEIPRPKRTNTAPDNRVTPADTPPARHPHGGRPLPRHAALQQPVRG